MTVVTLCGGVGATRFLSGLVQVREPAEIVAVVNVADDETFHGLHVSPDIDTVVYTLAGLVDETRGWGVRGDTFAAEDLLGRYGAPTWLHLGDRDLATHVLRTELLRQGLPLSEVTARLAGALGVGVRILPATDDQQRTLVRTPDGWLEFQEYFVRRGAADRVLEVRFARRIRPKGPCSPGRSAGQRGRASAMYPCSACRTSFGTRGSGAASVNRASGGRPGPAAHRRHDR